MLTLAASSEEEKDKWLEDITEAIDFSKNLPNDENISYLSLKSCSKIYLLFLYYFSTYYSAFNIKISVVLIQKEKGFLT